MTRRLVASLALYFARIDGASESDPLDLPIDRLLNRVYAWLTADANEQAVEKLDARLWMPPPGVVAEQGPWTAEAETSALGALQTQIAGSPKPSSA